MRVPWPPLHQIDGYLSQWRRAETAESSVTGDVCVVRPVALLMSVRFRNAPAGDEPWFPSVPVNGLRSAAVAGC